MIRRFIPRLLHRLPALLAAAFIATHTAALAHEYEHVFHQHDEPCAQHVMADQLAKALAPVPPTLPLLEPLVDAPAAVSVSRGARPAPSYIARAPPLSLTSLLIRA